ncbi:MAG: ATP-binding protein [Capsulimonadaceae bacterium]|nr:ATP-binding protein [Capsulimonadaceae bacterium]
MLRSASLFIATLGGIVLVSWHAHYLPGLRLLPFFAVMAYNAAFCFLVLGLGFFFALSGYRRAACVAALVTGTIGGLTLIEFIGNVDLHIDELTMKCYINSGYPPYARMAISSAVCFVLAPCALALMSRKTARPLDNLIIVLLGGIVFLLGIVGASGYLTGASLTYAYGYLTRMALHTSIAFVVLGAIIVADAWSRSNDTLTGTPSWLPALPGMACLALTLIVWQTLVVHQAALDASAGHLSASSVKASGNPIRWAESLVLIEEVAAGLISAILLTACAFFHMRSRHSAAELALANGTLEAHVAQRTAELAQANDEIELSSKRMKVFVMDVLASVTEGRLRLCNDPSELPAPFPTLLRTPIPLSRKHGMAELRSVVKEACGILKFQDERFYDLLTATGEAAMNAIVHATEGVAEVRVDGDSRVQIWIRDFGSGIDMRNLPRATLERGFTTAGSLGHGIKMILQTADAMWLLTGASGTTVVLEQSAVAPTHAWSSSDWPGVFPG